MISIQFDFSQLEAAARSVGARADQIPYALSVALNEATEVTRKYLINQTWPTSGIKLRNRSFMQASLTTKGARATKSMLSVEIYDRLNRGHLVMQEKGGTRVAKAGTMAIPIAIKRGARGVPAGQRPKVLPNSFRKGDAILQRVGGKKSKRLRVAYALKRATPIKPRVPFHKDFAASMERELRIAIPMAVRKAMRTAR